MKRLLWLISLIYAVPLAAGISVQANAGGLVAVQGGKNQTALKSVPVQKNKKKTKSLLAMKQGQPADPGAPLPTPGTPAPADALPAPSQTLPSPSGVTPTPPTNAPSPVAPAFPEAPAVPAPPLSSPSVPSSPTSEAPTGPASPASIEEAQKLRQRLDGISRQEFDIKCPCFGPLSPALTFANPSGFGSDNNSFFLSGSYQNRTRFTNQSDGELGFGVGLGDARSSIGAELSYSLNSFNSNTGFGSGGFNAKLHKLLDDDLGIAIGWNRFLNIGDSNGFPNNSYYLAGTKVFSTTNEVDSFLSRIALTAGVGGGQFQSVDALNNGENGLNVFGSLGFRIAKPLSGVVEWTGQDLAASLSFVPFDGFPLVISPGFRDIGTNDGARFVFGTGFQYNF
jgi:hypothetical protein